MPTRRSQKQKGGAFNSLVPMDTPKYGTPIDDEYRCVAHSGAKEMVDKWLSTREEDINKVLAKFNNDGSPLVETLSATAFNDLYKWTMMPVMRRLEQIVASRAGDVPNKNCEVTFGVDLRDEGMRKALKKDVRLEKALDAALSKLVERPFKREMFDQIMVGPRAGLITEDDLNAICGPVGSPRNLVDKVIPLYDASGNRATKPYERTAADADKVTVCFYFKEDAMYKDGEKGVHFIEATGPWHKVTWLETSMMQCVYEAKLRYDLAASGTSYNEWLYGALLRCAKSTIYTRLVQGVNPILPALFTGRRTGGLLFLVLQNLFFADHFKQAGALFNGAVAGLSLTDADATMSLGSSSCESWSILKSLGLPCLNPAGTHAHELSMVTSVLFPQLDANDMCLPLTQVVGHYLYYKLVHEPQVAKLPVGAIFPMAMLPDTLGTRAFMKAAKYVFVDGEPFLNKIGTARQDSGTLADFVANMADFGFTKGKMASEIDDTITLLKAAQLKYPTFGAGGFFGDSEKVWGDKNASSNSMAVKAVRVVYPKMSGLEIAGIKYMTTMTDGRVLGYPVKIGDPSDGRSKPQLAEGKLSVDKSLNSGKIKNIKDYAGKVRVGAAKGAEGYVQDPTDNCVDAPVVGKDIAAIFNVETGPVSPNVNSIVRNLTGINGGGRRSRRNNRINNRRGASKNSRRGSRRNSRRNSRRSSRQ